MKHVDSLAAKQHQIYKSTRDMLTLDINYKNEPGILMSDLTLSIIISSMTLQEVSYKITIISWQYSFWSCCYGGISCPSFS